MHDIEFVLDDVESVAVLGGPNRNDITIGDGAYACDRRSDIDGDFCNDCFYGFVNLNDDEDADVWEYNDGCLADTEDGREGHGRRPGWERCDLGPGR